LETDSTKPSGVGRIEGGHKASNTASFLGCVMETVDPTDHTVFLQNKRCENNTHINLIEGIKEMLHTQQRCNEGLPHYHLCQRIPAKKISVRFIRKLKISYNLILQHFFC
jgi:hypothetical protein